MDLLEKAQAIKDQIIDWRRDIHMHPELGFEETRTSRLVANTLREMGIEIETGIGGTGVVAHIGEGRPAIGIRADMDALPINEANDVAYKSQTPGVMHACGHDAHTAMLLGVAKILSEIDDLPPGEIRLLFQPCEEKWGPDGESGATAMIKDNALNDLDAVIALHVSSTTDSGVVEVGTGKILAAVDTFDATIIGEGCHGAAPHNGLDPIFLSAQVINAVQGIRSRRLKPIEPSVVTIGMIHGGSAHNIIPDQVQLKGTIRSYNEEVRSQIHEELHKAFEVVRALGGDFELSISRGYPALDNNPEVVDLIREVAAEAVGNANSIAAEPGMGAEDFAYMAQKAPGAMFFLGAKLDDVNRPHHSPIFDIDEEPLPAGTAILAETALRLLRQKA